MVTLFADDTIHLVDMINEKFNNIYDYLSGNSLLVNVNKSECMIVYSKTRRTVSSEVGVCINCVVGQIKYLGVVIYCNLNF